MRIDPKKFVVDESRSNPMAAAAKYPDCPINEICMFIVSGFGGAIKQCRFLKVEGDDAECTHNVRLPDI
jgi:hypothetical protein